MDIDFDIRVSGAPNGVTRLRLVPTAPFHMRPELGEEVTVTLKLVGIEREERL